LQFDGQFRRLFGTQLNKVALFAKRMIFFHFHCISHQELSDTFHSQAQNGKVNSGTFPAKCSTSCDQFKLPKIMKLNIWNKIVLALGISSIAISALVLVSGCVVRPDGRVAFAPVVVAPAPIVVAPPPAPVVVATVPDDYVWDGYEYVGVVGDQYYYLGPGDIWLVCDPIRLERFHGWEGGHPDWRAQAIRNDRYRNDSHGHYQPRHDDRH